MYFFPASATIPQKFRRRRNDGIRSKRTSLCALLCPALGVRRLSLIHIFEAAEEFTLIVKETNTITPEAESLGIGTNENLPALNIVLEEGASLDITVDKMCIRDRD